jgi:hypothetical protein
MIDSDREQLEFELWLDQRFDSTITLGITTSQIRRQRARQVLLEGDRCAIKLKSSLSGKTETLETIFGRIYLESLMQRHESGDGV